MCNIVAVRINDKDTKTYLRVIDIVERVLYLRGRDTYTFYENAEKRIYVYLTFKEFISELNNRLLENKPSVILAHSRAIPETEQVIYGKPSLYSRKGLIVAHHGLIPNAEKYNNTIDIDSELLLDIYLKDRWIFGIKDKDTLKEWFINSLRKYPRATTEAIYDEEKDKLILATNFMPLYQIEKSCSVEIYSTYNDVGSFMVNPYEIIFV